MKRITSEEPIEHWGFLNVTKKVVLDLGCGKFHSSITTPEWFIEKDAHLVIGIDFSRDIEDSDKFIFHSDCIDSTDKIKKLIEYYVPDVIKADIEGAEKYFGGISKKELFNVKEIAIEYHDKEMKDLIMQKIAEWAFGIVDVYQLMDIDIERMGVIHAKIQNL